MVGFSGKPMLEHLLFQNISLALVEMVRNQLSLFFVAAQ